jgi:hypothetical protein
VQIIHLPNEALRSSVTHTACECDGEQPVCIDLTLSQQVLLLEKAKLSSIDMFEMSRDKIEEETFY